jgi:hypothetical protein
MHDRAIREGEQGVSTSEAAVDGPFIDYENIPAPTEGILVTHFIIVRSIARSRAFYSEVLGGKVVQEENPCIVKLANSWILMNPGGSPTPDKPDISVVNYEPGDPDSTFMNLRVADIQACYEEWSAGSSCLDPPARNNHPNKIVQATYDQLERQSEAISAGLQPPRRTTSARERKVRRGALYYTSQIETRAGDLVDGAARPQIQRRARADLVVSPK